MTTIHTVFWQFMQALVTGDFDSAAEHLLAFGTRYPDLFIPEQKALFAALGTGDRDEVASVMKRIIAEMSKGDTTEWLNGTLITV